MFDFARRAKLALGDTARRTALKVVAGVFGLIAAGFLVAALWSWLANDLDWGSTLASLTVAGVLLLVVLILFAMSSKRKHEMPTSDDLRREVEARVSLAADAAVERVRTEASNLVTMAETKATSLMDQAGTKATQFAHDAEDKLFGSIRSTARTVGLTSENLHAAERKVGAGTRAVGAASSSNAGSMAKLVGAFAIGVTIAASLNERRGRDDGHDDYDDPDDIF